MARKKNLSKGRLFGIGDIHGCVDELAAMLTAIAPVKGDTVVFVAGQPIGRPGTTNLMKLHRVGELH